MTPSDNKIMLDALALTQVIASLRLPKKTRMVGTREGTEIHRPDGISYRIQVIEPRAAS